jgi:hypothetical protein
MQARKLAASRFALPLVLVLLASVVLALLLLQTTAATAGTDAELVYEVKATNARLNRKVLGEVTSSVQGVAAEPVHSFVWDGDGSVPIEGRATLEVDPVANTGEIHAEWHDENGSWTFSQTVFAPPEHSDGLRVGPSASTTQLEFGDPISLDVYLHGDTTAGGAVLPTLFNLIATWGPAEVTLNGQPFENPFDGPAPLWAAHTMTTVGARNPDGTVRTVDGEIFDPKVNPANGAVDYNDLEFHLVFHDAPGPELTNNFPPPHAFFYHLTFEDVEIEVRHSD